MEEITGVTCSSAALCMNCSNKSSLMPTVAKWSRRTYPAPLGAGGVGSIPANSDAQNVPSFRRWRFEMKLSPYIYIHVCIYI